MAFKQPLTEADVRALIAVWESRSGTKINLVRHSSRSTVLRFKSSDTQRLIDIIRNDALVDYIEPDLLMQHM